LTESDRCPACRARIASNQRYCLECGQRLVAIGPPLSLLLKQPEVPLPRRRVSVPGPKAGALLTAAALGIGMFVGSAINAGSGVTSVATGAPGLAAGSQLAAAAPPLQAPGLGAPIGSAGAAKQPAGPAVRAAVPAPSAASVPAAPISSVPSTTPSVPTHAGENNGLNQDQSTSGVVVHVNASARSYALDSRGQLLPIHTAKLPQPGTKVSVPIEPLSNGTFAEAGKRMKKKGRFRTAQFDGTVTFIDQEAATYTVSAHGASVLIHVQPATPAAAQMPQPGTRITVRVTIARAPAVREAAREAGATAMPGPPTPAVPGAPDPGSPGDPGTPDPGTPTPPPPVPVDPGTQAALPPLPCPPPPVPIVPTTPPAAPLWQRRLLINGQATGPVDLEGIVQASCPAAHQLLLSADDIREGTKDLVLNAGDGIDLSRLAPAQPVDVTATLGADGSYLVSGLVGDQGRKGADETSSGQGDQAERSPARLRAEHLRHAVLAALRARTG
jgi:hypothetical protein